MMATILCVDDEQHLLEDVAEIMESCGHKALKASDGSKGLRMILHLKPDLVISDISMPGMSGLELMREVRDNHPDFAEMPFIILSALSDRNEILSGLDQGADDYLTKPVDFDLLERKVFCALRQVARIKQKNEWELIKLVDSLSTPDDLAIHDESVPPKSGKTDFEIDGGNLKSAEAIQKSMPRDISDGDLAWRDAPGTKRVHGATLNLKNKKSKKTCRNKSLVNWVANTASDLVKQLFPDKGAVVVNKNGGVFVCYEDASASTAAKRTNALRSKVDKKLRDKSVPKPATEEEILDLTLEAEAPLMAKVSKKCFDEADDFNDAVAKTVDQTIPRIETVSDLMSLLGQRMAEVQLLKLLDRKGKVLPIKFFNFDPASREYISVGFSSFGEESFSEACYKIDVLFLKLLAKKLGQLIPTDIIMVDVHYTTLISPEYQSLYIPKVKEFAKSTRNKLILNIRGVTKASKSKTFQEVLKPLGIAAKGCTIQITPEEYENFIEHPLPVSGIVCSYLNTIWDTFSADLVQKARASLNNSRVPMIVRGVPSLDDAAKLQKFGFDGYGISND